MRWSAVVPFSSIANHLTGLDDTILKQHDMNHKQSLKLLQRTSAFFTDLLTVPQPSSHCRTLLSLAQCSTLHRFWAPSEVSVELQSCQQQPADKQGAVGNSNLRQFSKTIQGMQDERLVRTCCAG